MIKYPFIYSPISYMISVKQGVDSIEDATPAKTPSGSDVDDSSEETEISAHPEVDDSIAPPPAAASAETPKKRNLLDDFVHSPAPQISSLVEITRGHDPITSAMPSSSLHSSQEDLTAPAAAVEAQNAKVSNTQLNSLVLSASTREIVRRPGLCLSKANALVAI